MSPREFRTALFGTYPKKEATYVVGSVDLRVFASRVQVDPGQVKFDLLIEREDDRNRFVLAYTNRPWSDALWTEVRAVLGI